MNKVTIDMEPLIYVPGPNDIQDASAALCVKKDYDGYTHWGLARSTREKETFRDDEVYVRICLASKLQTRFYVRLDLFLDGNNFDRLVSKTIGHGPEGLFLMSADQYKRMLDKIADGWEGLIIPCTSKANMNEMVDKYIGHLTLLLERQKEEARTNVANLIIDGSKRFQRDVADALSDFFGERIDPSRVDALMDALNERCLTITDLPTDEDE